MGKEVLHIQEPEDLGGNAQTTALNTYRSKKYSLLVLIENMVKMRYENESEWERVKRLYSSPLIPLLLHPTNPTSTFFPSVLPNSPHLPYQTETSSRRSNYKRDN
jgi:hypothetical protein